MFMCVCVGGGGECVEMSMWGEGVECGSVCVHVCVCVCVCVCVGVYLTTCM